MTSSSLPDWVLFDRYVLKDSFPDDEPTEAACTNSRGDEVRICFQLHEPPRPSHIYLSWPAGKGGLDRFFVVAAHRDAVLFQMVYPIPVPGKEFPHDMNDYLLYTAAGDNSRGPSLHLLPSVDGTMAESLALFETGGFVFTYQDLRRLEGLDMGVLRCGEYCAVVELQMDRFAEHPVELHVLYPFCSGSGRWQVTHPKIAILDSELNLDKLLLNWRADAVVPFQSYLCWVDYCLGGILLCKVFDGSSDLKYLPLPATMPDLDRDIQGAVSPDLYQTLGVSEDHGVIKFVMLVRGDGQMIGYKFNPAFGFKITSWTLKITETNMSWAIDTVLKSEDLWKLDGFAQLPHKQLYYPVFSMANPSIICFGLSDEGKVEIGYEYYETWLVAIDLPSRAVMSCCHYINGKEENLSPKNAKFIKAKASYFDTFIPSELSKYLKLYDASAIKQGQGSSHFIMASDPRAPKRKYGST